MSVSNNLNIQLFQPVAPAGSTEHTSAPTQINSSLAKIQPISKEITAVFNTQTPTTMKEAVSDFGSRLMTIGVKAAKTPKATALSIWKGTTVGAITGALIGAGSGIGFVGGFFLGAFLGGLCNTVKNVMSAFTKQGKIDLLEAATRNEKEIKTFKDTTLHHTKGKKTINLSNLSAQDLEGGASKIATIMLNAKNNTETAQQKVSLLNLSNNDAVNDQFIADLLAQTIPKPSTDENAPEPTHGLNDVTINVQKTAINDLKRLESVLQANEHLQVGDGVTVSNIHEGAEISFEANGKKTRVLLKVSDPVTASTPLPAETPTAETPANATPA